MRTLPIHMLEQIFSYDPESGLVFWKIPRPRAKIKPGDLAGNLDPCTGYMRVMFNQRQFKLHRIAWALSYKYWPDIDIDHINSCRNDNRLINLRLATRSENIQNTKKRKGLCTLKGVTPSRNKFAAQINIDGVQKKLGVFISEQEAHNAYCEAAKIAFGQFFNPDCLCHQSGLVF